MLSRCFRLAHRCCQQRTWQPRQCGYADRRARWLAAGWV